MFLCKDRNPVNKLLLIINIEDKLQVSASLDGMQLLWNTNSVPLIFTNV